MKSINFEHLLPRVAVVALALLVCNFILDGFLDKRSSLIEQRDANLKTLSDDQVLLKKQDHLRKSIAEMKSALNEDTSAVEGKFLHLTQDWADQSGVHNTSFQRLRAENARGFAYLTFHASATGNLWSVAQLLYRMETSPIPLRIDSVNIRPKSEKGDEVQIRLIVSTPCKTKSVNGNGSANVASAIETTEGGG